MFKNTCSFSCFQASAFDYYETTSWAGCAPWISCDCSFMHVPLLRWSQKGKWNATTFVQLCFLVLYIWKCGFWPSSHFSVYCPAVKAFKDYQQTWLILFDICTVYIRIVSFWKAVMVIRNTFKSQWLGLAPPLCDTTLDILTPKKEVQTLKTAGLPVSVGFVVQNLYYACYFIA